MYVDALTLAAIADEWRATLIGARIDTIIQPTEFSLALQCYARKDEGGGVNRWLTLSAHPQYARVHLTAKRPTKIANEPPPFVMLLRKYLEGTRVETINQPRWERVIEIVSGYRQEDGEIVRFRLIIEIMGRMSNIILCDNNNMILGSIKRVGADINRYRTISPGIPYVPPPPQHRSLGDISLPRLEATEVTADQLRISANEEGEIGGTAKKKAEKQKLWQLLNRHLLGWSPLVSREAVYRTTEQTDYPLQKDAELDIWEELAWNVREIGQLYDTRNWQPHMVEQQKGDQQRPIAFAPYPPEQYALTPETTSHPYTSINQLLDEYYERVEWVDALEGVRAPIRKVLQSQLDRCLRKEKLLEEELSKSNEAATYRLAGDLLLAHQHEVARGVRQVTLENFFETQADGSNAQVTLELDPRYDAIGNANRFFHKYQKLQRALKLIPDQIEQNRVETETIKQLLSDLKLADKPAEVVLVKAEVQEAGYLRGKQLGKEKKKGQGKGKKGQKGKPVPPGGGLPMQARSPEGFVIMIGKNSRQNEEVTFRQATSNDLWLHARGVPGAHVIIKTASREVPKNTIEYAARLAAYYSEGRGSTNVPVDITLQKHLRHMKGGGPGMVVYTHERTIYAQPMELTN